MTRYPLVLLLAAGTLAAACVDNPAPGNDREAALDPPARPAQVATAEAALQGVSPHLVMPEIITDADQRNLPDVGGSCRFRMTRVGFPVVVYGRSGIVKLNGKLVPLDGRGDGRFSAGGVEVSVRPLEDAGDGEDDGGQFPAEFVIRLPGASDELGFHGYGEC